MNKRFSAQASWIWLLDPDFSEEGRRVFFRKSFDLEAVPGKVLLRIAADSRYMLYVNGSFVNYGSERSGYHGSWPCDTVDIAPYLNPGENVLAIRVIHLAPDVFCQPAAFYGGLLFEIPELGIFSDHTVKAIAPQGFVKNTPKTSFQYVRQEWADLNQLPRNWQLADFDDSDWGFVDYFRHSEAEPYGRIIDRETPLPGCKLVEPELLMQCSYAGETTAEVEPVSLYCRENPPWHDPAADGNVRAFLYDFGRTQLGTVLLEYSAASGDETIDLLYTEARLPDGTPFLLDPAAASKVATASRVKIAPGDGSHELDMPVGTRFIVAVIRGKSAVNIKISLRDMSYPWHFTGKFHSSDARLNELYLMSVNTQKACAGDTYTDCPWREQAQWWGDARIQAINTFALCTDTTLLRRGIRMIGETESTYGLTHAFAPATRWNTMIPDFSLCWILTVYDYFFQTADTRIFEAQSARIAQVLGYFLNLRDENGCFQKDDRYWNFYDWGFDHRKEPFPVLGNMILLYTLEKVSLLESVSGKTVEFDHGAAGKLRNFFTGFFHSPDGKLFLNEPRTAAFAIIAGLLDSGNTAYALDTVSREVAVTENPGGASPYFIYYLFEALKKCGRKTEVIDCIRRRWGLWLDLGLTTTPESWATVEKYGRTSLCHAWSAHIPAHFRDIILGVTQAAPGWKKVRFEPVYAGVDTVSGAVPTPLGNIRVEIDHLSGKKAIILPEGIERI